MMTVDKFRLTLETVTAIGTIISTGLLIIDFVTSH